LREQVGRSFSIILLAYLIIRLLGSYPLFAQHDARSGRRPNGLAERSISECQWVTVDKLAALRILNVQNTHLSMRTRVHKSYDTLVNS